MIQFVRYRRHGVDGTHDAFAFYDTVTDRFIEIGGDQLFDSVEELTEAAGYGGELPRPLEQLVALVPDGWEQGGGE